MYLYIKTIHCIVKVNNKTCFHKWGRIKVYFHKLDYFAILRCHFITFITLLSLTMAPMPGHPHIVPWHSSSTLTWHFWNTPWHITVIHCLTTNTLAASMVVEVSLSFAGQDCMRGWPATWAVHGFVGGGCCNQNRNKYGDPWTNHRWRSKRWLPTMGGPHKKRTLE